MLANKDPFIKRYNILEELCAEKYPQLVVGNPKNAIIHFAETSGIVSKKDQRLLKAIVAVRNTIHDSRNLFNVNTACLQFMDGVITALKTGATGRINTELENLKRSNVNKMLDMMKHLQTKIYIISSEEQRTVKAKLTGYIESEKRASSEERAKSFYDDFYSYFNNLHNLPALKKARSEHRERSLEKKKQSILSKIQHFYNQALVGAEDASLFSRGKIKKKLKQIFDGYQTRVVSCNDFDDLDDLLDNAEMDLDVDYT